MDEQRREGHDVSSATWAKVRELRAADEVWIHCGWMPCLWWAAVVCFLTQRRRGAECAERILKWMPEACYDPVRLRYHGWKKWLVGPIERWCLRRCDRIVATCDAEMGWIQSYLGKHCPPVEVTDIKRFFRLPQNDKTCQTHFIISRPLHLLYLGRCHPLKGVEYLEQAVAELNSNPVNPVNPVQNSSARSTCPTYPKNSAPPRHSLRSAWSLPYGSRPPSRGGYASPRLCVKIISNAFGEELEKIWDWCDVLVLPTLSDNFGLVIAEALERGKRVITTDGAPAWGDGNDYGGRLIYLEGYRDGTDEERVELLKKAIERICK